MLCAKVYVRRRLARRAAFCAASMVRRAASATAALGPEGVAAEACICRALRGRRQKEGRVRLNENPGMVKVKKQTK